MNIFLIQRLVVSPAGFHVFIVGLLDLLLTCQSGLELLTHLFSHGEGEGVTGYSLDQENSGIAAPPRIHCREGKVGKIHFIL